MASDAATVVTWIGGIALVLGLVATNPDDPANTAFKAHMRAELERIIRAAQPRDLQTLGCQAAAPLCRDLLMSQLSFDKDNLVVATVYRVFLPGGKAMTCFGVANKIFCVDRKTGA
jgi:hypothetical protein